MEVIVLGVVVTAAGEGGCHGFWRGGGVCWWWVSRIRREDGCRMGEELGDYEIKAAEDRQIVRLSPSPVCIRRGG